MKPTDTTLAAFIDDYIAGRGNSKPTTLVNLKGARKYLVNYFGADRPLDSITPGDADEFRGWLAAAQAGIRQKTGEQTGEKRLHDNTVRRICGRAKQFFRAAQRKRLIAESPFADMKGTSVKANRSRDYFVTRDEAQSGAGRLPRRAVEANLRPEPLRRPALPVRALGADVGRRGLGTRQNHCPLA